MEVLLEGVQIEGARVARTLIVGFQEMLLLLGYVREDIIDDLAELARIDEARRVASHQLLQSHPKLLAPLARLLC